MRLKTEKIYVESDIDKESVLTFTISIDVSKGGIFSAIIPSNIVELYEASNIPVDTNRVGTKGYYAENDIDKLINSIKKDAKRYLSVILMESKIVIRYSIDTIASYCINNEGEFVPNPTWGDNGRYWINGTEPSNATWPQPFGIKIFAKPYKKEIFQVQSTGKIFIKYSVMTAHGLDRGDEDKPNLSFLVGICGATSKSDLLEIDYTEINAKFFVDLYKAIFMLNEKIKPFIKPEELLKLIESQKKLF